MHSNQCVASAILRASAHLFPLFVLYIYIVFFFPSAAQTNQVSSRNPGGISNPSYEDKTMESKGINDTDAISKTH